AGGVQPTGGPLHPAALNALRLAILKSHVYEDDYVNWADVGNYLVKLSPDLHPRNYGFQRLQDFAVASGIVEVKMKSRLKVPPIALVRLQE
ncbi:hypothetical protein LTR86_003253, partial [Recurvomyces mirabilis]